MKLTLTLALLGALAGHGLAFNWCQPCKELVGFIETEVTRDEGEEDKILDAACAKIVPYPFLVKVCDIAVNEGLKIVVHDIDTKQPPPVVCHEAHLCDSLEDEAVDPAQVCQQAINFAEAFLHKFFNNKYAHKYCKELAHMADVDLICKDVKADIKQAIAALKAKCPKAVAEVAPVEKFDPSQVCPYLEAAKNFLDSGDVEQACEALEQAIHFPAKVCQQVAAAGDGIEKILGFAIQELHCSSMAEVAPVEKFDPSQACPALKDILDLLKTGDVDKICTAVEKEIPQLPKGLCKKIAVADNGIEMVLKIVVKFVCPSLTESVAAEEEGALPPQLCSALQMLKGFLNSGLQDYPIAQKVCAKIASEVGMSCADLVKNIDAVIDDTCPSSAAGQMSIEQHLALASNQACQVISTVVNQVKQLEAQCSTGAMSGEVCDLLNQAKPFLNIILNKLSSFCH